MALDAAGFRAAAERLIGRGFRAAEPVAVAVSGGPDSLAMLLLAEAAFGKAVRALTVDHRLRADSGAEAAAVARLCAARGIRHAVLAVTVTRAGEGMQAAARRARYAAMAERCAVEGAGWLMTAHHADDQAETLLMRLARGSGLAGLSGIRARRPLAPGVELLRPLLGIRRGELTAIVEVAGIAPVDDPSNRDPAYDRTAARETLARDVWIDAGRIAESASHLAEAEAALEWMVEEAWAGRAEATDGVVLDVAGLPAELVRRLVRRAIQWVAPGAAPDGPALSRLILALEAGKPYGTGGVAARPGRLWRFRPAPRPVSKAPRAAD